MEWGVGVRATRIKSRARWGQGRGRQARRKAVGRRVRAWRAVLGCLGPQVVNHGGDGSRGAVIRHVASTAHFCGSVGMDGVVKVAQGDRLQAAAGGPNGNRWWAELRRQREGDGVMAANTLAGKHHLCPAWAWVPLRLLSPLRISFSLCEMGGDSLDPAPQKEVGAEVRSCL